MTLAKFGKKFRRAPRCKHVHVSGRRCSISTSADDRLCALHGYERVCAECKTMKETFIPPKGW